MNVREVGMRSRMPGQSVMEKLLDEHGKRPQPTSLARVFGASPIYRDDVAWHIGAVGEQAVARLLGRLPDGWSAFHSLPIGKGDSDFDHVVVGPGGIFVLNTKHHSGKKIWVGGRALMVSGQRKDYIRASEFEADRLTKIIQKRYAMAPAVVPVIVFVGTESITVKAEPDRVAIQTSRFLVRWLRKRPAILRPEAVDLLSAMMNDPATWRAAATVDQELLLQKFNQLTRAHEKARLLRALWAVLGGVVILALAGWLFTSALPPL